MAKSPKSGKPTGAGRPSGSAEQRAYYGSGGAGATTPSQPSGNIYVLAGKEVSQQEYEQNVAQIQAQQTQQTTASSSPFKSLAIEKMFTATPQEQFKTAIQIQAPKSQAQQAQLVKQQFPSEQLLQEYKPTGLEKARWQLQQERQEQYGKITPKTILAGTALSVIGTLEFGKGLVTRPRETIYGVGYGIKEVGRRFYTGELFPKIGKKIKQEPGVSIGYIGGEIGQAYLGGKLISSGIKGISKGKIIVEAEPKTIAITKGRKTIFMGEAPVRVTQKGLFKDITKAGIIRVKGESIKVVPKETISIPKTLQVQKLISLKGKKTISAFEFESQFGKVIKGKGLEFNVQLPKKRFIGAGQVITKKGFAPVEEFIGVYSKGKEVPARAIAYDKDFFNLPKSTAFEYRALSRSVSKPFSGIGIKGKTLSFKVIEKDIGYDIGGGRLIQKVTKPSITFKPTISTEAIKTIAKETVEFPIKQIKVPKFVPIISAIKQKVEIKRAESKLTSVIPKIKIKQQYGITQGVIQRMEQQQKQQLKQQERDILGSFTGMGLIQFQTQMELPALAQTYGQIQIQQPAQKQMQRLISIQRGYPEITPKVPLVPFVPFVPFIPPFVNPFKEKPYITRPTKVRKQRFAYVPSVGALIYDITAPRVPKQKKFTGLELRPYVGKKIKYPFSTNQIPNLKNLDKMFKVKGRRKYKSKRKRR